MRNRQLVFRDVGRRRLYAIARFTLTILWLALVIIGSWMLKDVNAAGPNPPRLKPVMTYQLAVPVEFRARVLDPLAATPREKDLLYIGYVMGSIDGYAEGLHKQIYREDF